MYNELDEDTATEITRDARRVARELLHRARRRPTNARTLQVAARDYLDTYGPLPPQPTRATASVKGGSIPSVIASDGASVHVAGNGVISAFAIAKPK